MPIYHGDILRVLALLSPLRHGFCSFFFLEHLKRTRRYITRRDRASSDNRGASYRHRKPPKLALFCGVPIPENWSRRLFVCCFAGYFGRESVLCAANIQATQMHVRPFTCLQKQRKSQQPSSQQRLVERRMDDGRVCCFACLNKLACKRFFSLLFYVVFFFCKRRSK